MTTWYGLIIWISFVVFYCFNMHRLSKKVRKLEHENEHLKVEVEVWKGASLKPQRMASKYRSDESWVPKADREPSPDEIASVYMSLGVSLPPSLERRIKKQDEDRDRVVEDLLRDLEAMDTGTEEKQ